MKTVTLLSILLLSYSSSFSQWVQTSGPSGGGVHDFATIGSTIFAASFDLGNGVYASTDNATTWHESGLQGIMLTHISARGNTLLASSTENSYNETDMIYRSEDGGTTWQKVLSIPNINAITSICAYQQNTWIVSAEGEGGMFFISSDDGITWNTGIYKPANFDFSNPIPLVSYQNVLIAGTNSDGVPTIERSADGVLWGSVTIDSLSQISCATVSGNTVWFAGIGGVISSNDGGLSWGHPANIGFENKHLENIISLASSGHHLIAVSSLHNIYYSWDGGNTWSKISGLPANASYFFSIFFWNDTYFLGSSSGIMLSKDSGVNWEYSTSGLRCSDLSALASYQNSIYSATERGITFSSDQGATWSDAQNNVELPDTKINGFFTNGNDFFAYGSGLYNWNGAWVAMDNNEVSAFTEGGTGRLFIARNGIDPVADTSNLLISDKGANWQKTLSFANSIDTEFTFIPNCLSANGSVILVVTRALAFQAFPSSYFISRSTDNGLSWSTISIPYSAVFITFADGSFYMGTSENGLFQSTNNGVSWDPIGFNSKSGVNSFLKIGSWLFVSVIGNGNNADGLYRRGNGGASWSYANEGAVNISGPLATDGTYLYTGRPSVWKIPLNQLGVARQENISEKTIFELYPNPADEVLHLHTSIPFPQANIIIYDEKGSAVLKQTVSFHDGLQDVSLSINGLSEGVYYARLLDKAGNEIARSQFVVLRK
ncbi:MAG: T9SS type A sorting domain-containing protein [Candidatus Kapaibacterium sp.]